MTVVLNPVGIETLFNSVPVAAFVERVGGRVAENARSNVRGYFHTAPTLEVDQDIGVSMQGSRAIIGIKDGGGGSGHKARLLVQYQLHGNSNGVVDWLLEAVTMTEEERIGS